MKKTVILLLLVINSFQLFCQQEITNFILDLKENNTEIKDVFPVINEKTGDFVLFISDSKNVFAYKFDGDFKVTDKIVSEKK